MPRKSDERGFGFRADGLLRILVRADAEQVLIAIEELGFRLPDRVPITNLVDLIASVHGEVESIVEDFIVDLARTVEAALDSLDLGVPPGHVEHGQAQAERSLRQLVARRVQFQLALSEKRARIEKQADELFFKIGAI